jgi:uncharacterized membrane protein
MNFQIQAWPTPEIFINRRFHLHADRLAVRCSLVSVVKPTADTRNLGAEPVAAVCALISAYQNPPVTQGYVERITEDFFTRVTEAGDIRTIEVLTDAAAALCSLVSVIKHGNVTRTLPAEAAGASCSLVSVFVTTPDTRDLSSTPETFSATASLVSVNSI